VPLAYAILVEALQAGEHPRSTRCASPARGEKRKQIGFLRLRETARFQEDGELRKIAPVRLERILRKAVLEPERVAKRVEQRRIRARQSARSWPSSQRFASSRYPPRAWPNPPIPPAAMTRWHGMTIGRRFSPHAWPTCARCAASAFATSP
jgi:hypothetical protein